MIFDGSINLEKKLSILADAAKYDVACTSSGMDRTGKQGSIGNTVAAGICHSFAADGRCISLLKVLYSNECVFDCKYCVNRVSNDVLRTSFTPEELCELTIEFYRRNYIEGLFLSSGIKGSPNETMDQIVRALMLLRTKYRFEGYIHCKVVPGADAGYVEAAGWYADRMSVNLELPTKEGLKNLAPHKTRKTILEPIRQIQTGIAESRYYLGMKGGNRGAYWYTGQRLRGELNPDVLLPGGSERQDCLIDISNSSKEQKAVFQEKNSKFLGKIDTGKAEGALIRPESLNQYALRDIGRMNHERGFAAAGQSTQMIVGATKESDYQIVSVAEALYQRFDLKRVFYSAFVNVNQDSNLPSTLDGPPLLREHRLYQADWLLRYYGFQANELLSEERPNFNVFFDPKCNWALCHLELFPIEINKADYFLLLRIPGIGMKSAKRIISARKMQQLRYEDLKKIGVVLKRAMYFITCNGKMLYPIKIEEDFITSQLLSVEKAPVARLLQDGMTYKQLTLFDDMNLYRKLSINGG